MKRKKQVMITFVLVAILALTSVGVTLAQDSIDDLPGSGWYTGLQIQNVGTGTANLQVTSYDANDTSKTYQTNTIQLQQDSSTTLLPDDMNIGGSFQGSAAVSSDQQLRAIVNTTNRPAGSYGIAGGKAAGQYQGVNSPSTTVNFPLAKNGHFNKTTTFYLQNAGTNPVSIKAEFKLGGGNCTINTAVIQPNRMAVVSPASPSSGCPSGDNTGLGSMTATSTEPLAGVVLEHGNEQPAVLLQATRGFSPSDADTTAYAPIIKTGWFNRFTGLQIQNTTGGNINVTVDYAGSGGACAGKPYQQVKNNLPAGESVTFVHLAGSGNPMPNNCLASAKVTATGGVVAIVNESFEPAYTSAGNRQESTTYSAFAGKSGTTKISAPLYKEDSYDKGTGLQVQNVGNSQDTNVVMTFIQSSTGTSYVTKPQTIPAGGSKTFVDVRKSPGLWQGTAMPSNVSDAAGVFAVVVQSAQPAVAVANESSYPFGNSPLEQDKNNYEGFNLTP